MSEPVSFSIGLEHVATAAGAIIAFLITRVVKSVDDKQSGVQGMIDEVSDKINTHDTRITVIEKTYIKREDVEAIVNVLQSELNETIRRGFDRAHQRIDSMYSRAPKARDDHE